MTQRGDATGARYMVVHPHLHGSGFGNQVGMLLQHVALAAFSGRALVLPALHEPPEHRRRGEAARLWTEDVLNLTAFAPLARVVSRRQLGPTIGSLKWHEHATLPFSAAAGGERARPLRLKPAPLPALLAAAQLLGERASCEEGGDGGCAVQHVAYCHTTTCRSRTRRACKRLAGGCARTAQRLPNNYLFEHRLGPLLCAEGSPLLARSPARGGAAAPDPSTRTLEVASLAATLQRHERRALAQLTFAHSVRTRASAYARALGGRYFAVHARLRDAERTGSEGKAVYNKGVAAAQLPQMLATLVRRIRSKDGGGGSAVRLIYLASNRPQTVGKLLPQIRAALSRAGFDDVLVRGWLDVARADTGMAPPDGLLAALVELELCSLAPLGFAGSSFSTWANLIGARRWAAAASMAVGDERRRAPAYVDLHSGASVPACAASGGLASEFRNRSVG